MTILYEDNHLLVALKEPFILSQSDGSNTPDMLTLLKKYLKEKYNKPGNVYLGLVHRKILREEYKSKIDKKGKNATLSFETLDVINNNSLVKINLLTGRHHQIRVQFSERGHYLLGDSRYGKKGKYSLALYAYHLAFYHPITKEKLVFESIPSDGYFSKFNVKELLKK